MIGVETKQEQKVENKKGVVEGIDFRAHQVKIGGNWFCFKGKAAEYFTKRPFPDLKSVVEYAVDARDVNAIVFMRVVKQAEYPEQKIVPSPGASPGVSTPKEYREYQKALMAECLDDAMAMPRFVLVDDKVAASNVAIALFEKRCRPLYYYREANA